MTEKCKVGKFVCAVNNRFSISLCVSGINKDPKTSISPWILCSTIQFIDGVAIGSE